MLADILLQYVLYIRHGTSICSSPKGNENATTINVLVPGPRSFLFTQTNPTPKLVAMIIKQIIWCRVDMAIITLSLRFITIVHGSFMFSF